MSLLYSSSVIYPEGNICKPQEFSDLDQYTYQQQQQPNLLNLSRFRSAPSSFFENLFNDDSDSNGGESGVGIEDFGYFPSSSPDMDQLMGRFEPAGDGCDDSKPHDSNELGVRSSVKFEEGVDSQVVCQNLPEHNLGNDNSVSSVGNSLDGTFRPTNSMDLWNSIQTAKMNIDNGTNLVRHSSSPAGIFPDLGIDNGRLSNHVNFSSGQRILPQIAEMGGNGLDGNNNKREYVPTNFTNDFWDDGSSIDFKRAKDNNGNIFSAVSTLDNQNGNTRLTHHWSMPKTMSEMATAEKFLQFESSVPHNIRAKRGCATHPRSIAERVRRTRISERMRKLQELFPDMDKQANTAEMLDLAVAQIKELQKQVKLIKNIITLNHVNFQTHQSSLLHSFFLPALQTLNDTKARCICPRE